MSYDGVEYDMIFSFVRASSRHECRVGGNLPQSFSET